MDNQLVYIIGFTVITLVALVVSLSVKFEHRRRDEHHGHDYDHKHVATLTDEIRSLAHIQNQSGDPNIIENKRTTKLTTIADLNNRFAFRKDADYTSSEELPIGTLFKNDYGSGDPIILIDKESNQDLINRGVVFQNGTPSDPAETKQYDENNIALITSRLSLKPPNQFNPDPPETTSGNNITFEDEKKYKIFVTTNPKSALYTFKEQTDTYEIINNIEYFGLTSNNNFPVPLSNPPIISTAASANYKSGAADISTLNTVPQVLTPTSASQASLRMGLFAKVSTNGGGGPGVGTIGDYTGFTANTTNYKIVDYTDFSDGASATVSDAMHNGETTDGTPYYMIFVINAKKDKCPSKIVCNSNVKNVQIVVLIVGDSSEFPDNVQTATVRKRSDLTGIGNIIFTKGQYYFQKGRENIYSIMFFRFNQDGSSKTYNVNIDGGKNIVPHVTSVDGNDGSNNLRNVVYVNYYNNSSHGRGHTNATQASYENYYHYDGAGTYTWRYRSGGEWVDASI